MSQLESIDESEKLFLKGAAAKGLTGLKGHRSVGVCLIFSRFKLNI
jgi:phosphoserine aminotransferase